MEIHKLTDDTPEGKLLNEKTSAIPDFLITDIRQGVKNPNRVNVFVDGKFEFSLDVTQVVDYKLKIGLKVSEKWLMELKRASEFGKLYQRALEKALTRPHSEKEIREYLYRKLKMSSSGRFLRPSLRGSSLSSRSDCGFPSEDIFQFSDEIIERLKSRGYVDDRKFAEFWAENRFVKKGISRKRLRMELVKKGVAKEIIDEVLDGRDETEEIRKMIKKKRVKYDDDKLVMYLCRQGFSYDLARKMVVEEGYEG